MHTVILSVFTSACRRVNQLYIIRNLPSHLQVNYVLEGDGCRNWDWREAFHSQLQAGKDWYIPWKAHLYFFFFLYIVTEEDQNVNEEILRWREELIFHVTHSNVVFSWENQVLLEMEINGNWGPCQAEKLQLLVCTSAVSPG